MWHFDKMKVVPFLMHRVIVSKGQKCKRDKLQRYDNMVKVKSHFFFSWVPVQQQVSTTQAAVSPTLKILWDMLTGITVNED